MGILKNLLVRRTLNAKFATPTRDDFSNAIHNYMVKNPNIKLNHSKLWKDFYEDRIDCRLIGIEKYFIK